MSAGPFQQDVYASDTGDFHNIRIQPETAEAQFGLTQNFGPSENANSQFWVKSSIGATEYGLHPRTVRLRWTGEPPAGYKPGTSVEVLAMTPSSFAAAIIGGGATYLGTAAQVIGKTSEFFYPES